MVRVGCCFCGAVDGIVGNGGAVDVDMICILVIVVDCGFIVVIGNAGSVVCSSIVIGNFVVGNFVVGNFVVIFVKLF